MRPRVVVIGGGFAGIAAAEVLAKAHFEVTLLEAGDCLGGKAAGFGIGSRAYEHGVHGYWPNYLNLFDLLNRAGIPTEEFFQRSNGTRTVIPGEGSYDNIPLKRKVWAPWHILAHLLKTPYLSWIDKVSLIPAGLAMLAFDPTDSKQYAEYDEYTFRGWLWRKGVSAHAYARLLEPFARALTFDSSSRISAAAVISSLQLYLLRGQRDIEPYWLKKNPSEVFERLHHYLKGLGVTILPQAKVTELKLDRGGWVEEVGYEASGKYQAEGERFQEIFVVKESDIQPGEVKTFTPSSPWRPFHARRTGEDLTAFDSLCTHSNNLTRISSDGFLCDAHGSTFNADGERIGGEARSPLRRLKVVHNHGGWSIQSAQPRVYEQADFVVSAAHLSAFRELLSEAFLEHPFFRAVENLETTPVIVGRFWFQGKADAKAYSSGFFVGDTLVDAFFVLPSSDENETVVEAQAYLVRDVLRLEQPEIEKLMLRDLKAAIPSLANLSLACAPKILKYENLFSLYEAGSNPSRPGTRTPIPNLFLAGDWIHTDRPVWNMERAVVSGIISGQKVLEAFGRNPDANPHPVQVIDLPQPQLAYRLVHRFARYLRGWSARWRRWRRCSRSRLEPAIRRLPERSERPPISVYHLICEVRKFVGKPNQSTVRGMLQYRVVKAPIRSIDRSAKPPVYTVSGGIFEIDLASISTRNQRRDENLRQFFFKVGKLRYLEFKLKNLRKAPAGESFEIDFEFDVAGAKVLVTAQAREVPDAAGPGRAGLSITATVKPNDFGFSPLSLSQFCDPEDEAEVGTMVDVGSLLDDIGKEAIPEKITLPGRTRGSSGGFQPLGVGDQLLAGGIPYDDRPKPKTKLVWPADEPVDVRPIPTKGIPL